MNHRVIANTNHNSTATKMEDSKAIKAERPIVFKRPFDKAKEQASEALRKPLPTIELTDDIVDKSNEDGARDTRTGGPSITHF